MDADVKRELLDLIERGDRYGLMLAAVALWVRTYHPDALRAALYLPHDDDAEPVRIRIPLSASDP